MKDLFPAFIDLTSQKCLVIGGGTVAERKVAFLLRYNAQVHVVSPDLTAYLNDLVAQGRIIYFQRMFSPADTDGMFLVIAAAGDKQVNRQLQAEYLNKGYLLNIADEPEKGNFHLPAVVKRGKLQLAISTSGASPLLANRIRRSLEREFGSEYERYLDILTDIRKEVLSTVPEPERRKRIFQAVLDSDLLELLRTGDEEKAKERVNQCLSW